MRHFDKILENALHATKTYYRGVKDSGLQRLKKTGVPGFLGDLKLGMIYAQPSLTGPTNGIRYLISADVDTSLIKNMAAEVPDMSSWKLNGPTGYLKDEIWTSEGSGHGSCEALYCGKPVPWRLEFTFNGDDEWRKVWEAMMADGRIANNDDWDDEEY